MKYENCIFNADDLGMDENIDKGIFLAAQRGLIQSASASMVNGVCRNTLIHFMKIKGPMSLGLHINLTEGIPASQKSKVQSMLTDAGIFKSAMLLLSREDSLSEEVLFQEMTSQLDRFVALTGTRPAHIDSHQHFAYLSPKAFNVFLQFAQKEKLKIRSPKQFLDPIRLQKFIRSVEARYNIQIPFSAASRARELNETFERYQPALRTCDCVLEFSDNICSNENLNDNQLVEFVCHPRYDVDASDFMEVEELSQFQKKLRLKK